MINKLGKPRVSIMILGTPIEKQSLQKMVRNILRQAILEGEIKPGEKLNIRKLAEKLMVSAMPIREALRELEAEGMISFHSNKRITASRLSKIELNDIYAIRIPLEKIALMRCFDLTNRGSLKELEELHRKMSRPHVIGKEWFNLNQAFHMKLHEMSGSPRLFQILQGLWNSTGPYLRIFSDHRNAIKRANEEHSLILQALRKGDRNLAKKVLEKHLKNGMKIIEVSLED